MSGKNNIDDITLQPHSVEKHALLPTAIEWYDAGLKVAIATVVQTWGSSPRPIGSQLIINEKSTFEGSVSGGCIEGEIVTESLDIMESNSVILMEFGVSNAMAWEVGLACGGTVKVYIESINDKNIECYRHIIASKSKAKAVVSLTHINDGSMSIWEENSPLSQDLSENCEKAIRLDKGQVVQLEDGTDIFINPHTPPMQMFIIGAVHISQALAPMAQAVGYDVIIIDHRTGWASEMRFPNVKLDHRWADDAFEDHIINHRCAIVTLSHDPKLDDPALICALKSPAFYIGALGSKKTHRSRLERLQEKGFTDSQMDRIDAPIGLDIGASSPAEIAIAIMGQVTLSLRGPKGNKKTSP